MKPGFLIVIVLVILLSFVFVFGAEQSLKDAAAYGDLLPIWQELEEEAYIPPENYETAISAMWTDLESEAWEPACL